MNEKDTHILQDTGLAVVEQAVSLYPPLEMAWKLSRGLFGAALKLRQEKALEWVEMVRAYPGIFTRDLLETLEFQDGFVFALEKYLTERNKQKRICFRSIFLGFAQSTDADDFPLEKFIHTLSQLSAGDILVLRDIDLSRQDKNYQIYGDTDKNISNIFNLITTGILHSDPSPRIGPIIGPYVWVSDFGKEFIRYISINIT